MKRIVLGSVFSILAGGLLLAQPRTPLVLKAARLFQATSQQVTSPGLVLVDGTQIIGVGVGTPVPRGAEVIELGDATLLPGFIDAHVHLSMEMSTNWHRDFYEGMMRFPAEQAQYAALYARRTLEAGFTTVRDLGSEHYLSLGLRNAIRDGISEGPTMLVCNYAVGSTAGHADQAPFPPELVAPAGPIRGVANGPDEFRAAVKYQIKYGADVIKFMPSGGVLSLSDPVDVPEMTQAEMDAVISEAHAWGRKVAAHCHGDAAARMAIQAGVDSIEHGTFLKPSTLELMKARGVFLVPTLSAGEWVGQHATNYPLNIAEKARMASAALHGMFKEAIRIGVKIALGTDAGVEPHGQNAKEFGFMVAGGMPPSDALLAGTVSAAELLGVADKVGTLEKGKLANIVAVRGDPLQDIHLTEQVVFVMKEGTIVKAVKP